MNNKRSWLIPLGIWTVFEIVAVTLWLAKDNLFYLFNFSYIGTSIALGLFLFFYYIKKLQLGKTVENWDNAHRFRLLYFPKIW